MAGNVVALEGHVVELEEAAQQLEEMARDLRARAEETRRAFYAAYPNVPGCASGVEMVDT